MINILNLTSTYCTSLYIYCIFYIQPFYLISNSTLVYYILIKFIDITILTNLLKYFAVTCANIQISNGKVNSSNSLMNEQYPFNTTIAFSCHLGYTLDTNGSSPSITCFDTGHWSHSIPSCNVGNKYILITLFLLL